MSQHTMLEPNIAARKSLRGERVLVCEDEGITQMQFSRILRRAGMELVGSAMTGEELVEIALRERPSVILMDINMPEMDGFEAMERIFAVYRPCMVVVSAYDEDIERRARAMGAQGYITKPVNQEGLLHDLEAAFQSC